MTDRSIAALIEIAQRVANLMAAEIDDPIGRLAVITFLASSFLQDMDSDEMSRDAIILTREMIAQHESGSVGHA